MKIAIGADHRGFHLKRSIKRYLKNTRHSVKDYGTLSTDPVDYPDIAIRVARAVAWGKAKYGILICLTGEGMVMTANKVKGVRAALCTDPGVARMTRAHNNANILVIPGSLPYSAKVRSIVNAFLSTRFEGGRHTRRVNKIKQYEKKHITKQVK